MNSPTMILNIIFPKKVCGTKSNALVAKQGFLFVCLLPSTSVTSKKNSLLYLLQDKFSPAALILVMEWKDLGCYKM